MLQHNGVQHILACAAIPACAPFMTPCTGSTTACATSSRATNAAPVTWPTPTPATGKVGVCEGPQRRRRDLSAARPGGGQRVVGARAGHHASDGGRLARQVSADRAGPGGTVPSVDQMELHDRPRRPDPGMRAAFRHMSTGKPGAAHLLLYDDEAAGGCGRHLRAARARQLSGHALRAGPRRRGARSGWPARVRPSSSAGRRGHSRAPAPPCDLAEMRRRPSA